MKLLVVDDEQDLTDYFLNSIAEIDDEIQVFFASTVDQFKQLMSTVDAVLADVHFCSPSIEYENMLSTLNKPVVRISGGFKVHDDGMFLSKPFTKAELFDCISFIKEKVKG